MRFTALEAINSIKWLANGSRSKQTVKHITQTQVESHSLQIFQKKWNLQCINFVSFLIKFKFHRTPI